MSSLEKFQSEEFWNSSDDFWQNKWNTIFKFFGNDPFKIEVYGTFIITFIFHWVFVAIYTIMDITQKPAILQRYRTRPETNYPMDKVKLKKTISLVLFNQIFIGLPLTYIGITIDFWVYKEYLPTQELPSLIKGVFQLIGCMLLYEIFFYYNHRILHWKVLYKRIHKIHHEWVHPTASMTLYCHPLDFALLNTIPHLIGPTVFHVHVAVLWIYLAIVLGFGVHDHTGYHLPFLRSQEFHDFHHLKFINNYGIFGLLDWIHGTDLLYRKSVQFKRDYVITDLVPGRDRYPDEYNKQGCKTL